MDAQCILKGVNQPVGCLSSSFRQLFQRILDAVVDTEDDVFADAQPVDVREFFLCRVSDRLQRKWKFRLQGHEAVVDKPDNIFACCHPVDRGQLLFRCVANGF